MPDARMPPREVVPPSDFFTGGPEALFDIAGREQLIALLENGLTADSRLVDIGCGALRGGRWIIPLLGAGNYYGLEPNVAMLEEGQRRYLGVDMLALKRPVFAHNEVFDLGEFGTGPGYFTHVLLRSVWTHSSKSQIETCLTSIQRYGTTDVVVLASVVSPLPKPTRPWRMVNWTERRRDYEGDSWAGRSKHHDSLPAVAYHSPRWLRAAAGRHGFKMTPLLRKPINGQFWLRLERR